MGNLYFGIAMARRGWLQPSDILNTLDGRLSRQCVRESRRCTKAAGCAARSADRFVTTQRHQFPDHLFVELIDSLKPA
jgi:hypothetical protein